MEIFALFMFLGIFTTLCIPETKRITLEVLSGEQEPESVAREGEGEGEAARKEANADNRSL